MELLSKLAIDWKLLIAQIVNFTILAIILFKLVYRPLLATLDKRTKIIEKGMHDAKAAEEKLASVEKMEHERMMETKKEIGRLIEEAKSDAETMKKDILAAAATQSEELLDRARTQIQDEKTAMLAEVKGELVGLIIQTSAKVMGREFSAEDQKRLVGAISNEMKSV